MMYLGRVGLVVTPFLRVVANPSMVQKHGVPYGSIINHCTVPGTVALTFDDGPYEYTSHILDVLDKYNASATFFVSGNNWGRGDIHDESSQWPDLLRRMVTSGHQVASHGYWHKDLTHLSSEDRRDEMQELAIAFKHVLGYSPTYMRPPYGSCGDDCPDDLGEMGYHVINYDLDTQDYAHNSPDAIATSMETFSSALSSGSPRTDSYLVLCHDVHQQTAYTLTEHMLTETEELGYRAVSVGECLDDPDSNWYRSPGRSKRAGGREGRLGKKKNRKEG